MSDHLERGAPLRGGAERSYLLRIRVSNDGARYLVQDLKTGERLEFGTEAELRRFIAERGVSGLR
jgi:hypothetical protein